MRRIRDQLVDRRDARGRSPSRARSPAPGRDRRRRRARTSRTRVAFSTYARLMTPQPDDPDFHATSPSMVMTRRERAARVLELGAAALVLLDDQPLDAGLDRRRHDALVADRAVADRAERVLAAHAEILDVHERPATRAARPDRRPRTTPSRHRARGRRRAAAGRGSPARPRRRGCGTRARALLGDRRGRGGDRASVEVVELGGIDPADDERAASRARAPRRRAPAARSRSSRGARGARPRRARARRSQPATRAGACPCRSNSSTPS